MAAVLATKLRREIDLDIGFSLQAFPLAIAKRSENTPRITTWCVETLARRFGTAETADAAVLPPWRASRAMRGSLKPVAIAQ
jgi:hypothetical protein